MISRPGCLAAGFGLAVVLFTSSCRTLPRSAPPHYPVRIALISDTHTTRGTKDDQPLHKPRLEKAIAVINAAQVDLVLVAGDLTENGKPEEFRDFKRQIRGFQAPVWYVPGNHDIGNKRLPDKKQAVTGMSVNRFEMALGPSYWVREHAGVRVVGANGPICGSGLIQEQNMWRLLEKTFAKPGPIPTLFMVHYSPYQKSADEPGGVYWNLEPYPRARLLALLKQGGVQTVLSGHLHKSLTNRFDRLTLLTTTTLTVGDPKKNPARGWMLLTVSEKGDVKIEPQILKDETPAPRE
jgi:3',5'-cyclic AMP phosphodiesterase CpdA